MKSIIVSSKQSEYLAKVASGERIADIAASDHAHPQTVRYQLEGLKISLKASTLPNLVAKGIQNKLIMPDGSGGFRPTGDNKS